MTDLVNVSAKQAFEWTKTGHWRLYSFLNWLEAKKIPHLELQYTPGGTLIHRAVGQLAYEWIKTKHWNFKQFQLWLNSFL